MSLLKTGASLRQVLFMYLPFVRTACFMQVACIIEAATKAGVTLAKEKELAYEIVVLISMAHNSLNNITRTFASRFSESMETDAGSDQKLAYELWIFHANQTSMWHIQNKGEVGTVKLI